jgi:hypothetical protein
MNNDLIKQYKKLHKNNINYGAGATYADKIFNIAKLAGFKTALDFGCGKGKLGDKLNGMGLKTKYYDPAVDEFSAVPNTKVDFVIANDVLEHLDPITFMADIRFMLSFAKKGLFLNISCRPAVHVLPNGQNCHTLVMPQDRWITLFKSIKNVSILGYEYHEGNKNLELTLGINSPYFCYTCSKDMIYYSDHSIWMCELCERTGPK